MFNFNPGLTQLVVFPRPAQRRSPCSSAPCFSKPALARNGRLAVVPCARLVRSAQALGFDRRGVWGFNPGASCWNRS